MRPTQTLTDLLTIKREKGHFDGLTVGFCGDLKFGRPVHSLVNALSRYENINFVLISPEELKLPDYVRKDSLDDCGSTLDGIAAAEDSASDENALRNAESLLYPEFSFVLGIEEEEVKDYISTIAPEQEKIVKLYFLEI